MKKKKIASKFNAPYNYCFRTAYTLKVDKVTGRKCLGNQMS